MLFLQKQNWRSLLLQTISAARNLKQHFPSLYCTTPPNPSSTDLKKLCGVVSSSIGGLDDLEASLSKFSIPLSPSLVAQVLDSCNNEAPTRRLLRFFLWSRNNLDDKLQDELYNHAIRVFAQKKDFTAMDMLISDLGKEGRKMETWTFSVVAEALVKLGREEEALGIFKNLVKFKCPQGRFQVTVMVSALCAKGHARKAEGVVWHHEDKISGVEPFIYRSLLYGWSKLQNVKAARRITK